MKKYTVDEVYALLKASDKLSDLKDENIRLHEEIDTLRKDLAYYAERWPKESMVYERIQFRRDPEEWIKKPYREVLNRIDFLPTWFKTALMYVEPETIKEFIEQPDNDLLKIRSIGPEKLKRIRRFQERGYGL